MVAFSSSYSTNGLTSPSAASLCSPFDPLGPGALGYVIPGSDISGTVLHSSPAINDVDNKEIVSGSIPNTSGDGEAKTGDSLPYPILRPIIIPNMSRQSYDRKSPSVPPNRREQPRIKRPPSPVVLCVPRAPHPPPSPFGDSRKLNGFRTVRSGSQGIGGVKGWFHDGFNFEETCLPMNGSEVVWLSCRKKSVSACQLTHPLAGALLRDRLIAISQLARDQEHIAAENLIRKPCINWVVKCVSRSFQVSWPWSRTNVFGSNANGLSLPSSDMDLVVCLPPMRNLDPIKEAGILEGRNGIKETCFQVDFTINLGWNLLWWKFHMILFPMLCHAPMPKEADQRTGE
ncbi:uncharacterized protein LOC111382992 [Olea europaea var. sylvestris]|uniref:uncharacterized protein LOC111382992 n=1 Tax=Olea europaea var. sylvestris TaxID=158386 RepID=UPI000C1D1C58|nr:uncharacterized protein LOC111382992 [Olea europaea var. sylvestris]XP_022862810.1 uncharacterized protein LOC111382992 [Olea europaea var. sylvestris]XP_022862817.1 uncharacterized protein LOC111382992 [Olea europaea var. sylvestris]XP_022862824.1 uncharacterized protein LOC111382992 [Olea europaea var. sylvestris]XP_022862831.1 uncharacterized protein LOC111382992 [Olea europaea var. sylvestris]XP_022862839.1 uncharacterized protein LOC111382992 [Olea europaea var. sylvestris]XP_02286284